MPGRDLKSCNLQPLAVYRIRCTRVNPDAAATDEPVGAAKFNRLVAQPGRAPCEIVSCLEVAGSDPAFAACFADMPRWQAGLPSRASRVRLPMPAPESPVHAL